MSDNAHSPTTASFISYHAGLGSRVAVELDRGGVSYAQLDSDIALACRYLGQQTLRYKDLLVIGLSDPYAHLVFVLAAELLGLMSCSIQMSEEVLPLDVMARAQLVLTQHSVPPDAGVHHQLPPDWRALAKDYASVRLVALQDADPVRPKRSLSAAPSRPGGWLTWRFRPVTARRRGFTWQRLFR